MNTAAISGINKRASARPFSMRIFQPSAIESVSAIWQELERRYGDGGLTCSWDWNESWLNSYGDIVPHRFAVGYHGGRPIGVALLTQRYSRRRGPISVKAVHIGTSGEPEGKTVRVEYNRILGEPRHRMAFARELLRVAGSSQLRCNELYLDGFSPEEMSAFEDEHSSMVVERHVSYVAELRLIADNGQSVLDALRRHTASKIKRSIQRLEELHVPIAVDWATSLDEAHEIFDELSALHNVRWNSCGQPGAFSSARFSQFHRDLIDRLFPAGRILIARVRAGETTVGCDYGMIEHGRVLSYQWGLAKFDDPRLSPGLVTGALIMQAAMERGPSEYDWLAGDVLYKRELSTGSRELIWAKQLRGVYVHVLDAAARTVRAARRGLSGRPVR